MADTRTKRQQKIDKETDILFEKMHPYMEDIIDVIDHLADIYQKQIDECTSEAWLTMMIGKRRGLETARRIVCFIGNKYSYEDVIRFIENGELT